MQEQKFFLFRPLLTAKMAARSLLRHITARIANEQKPCKKTWGGHSVFCAVNGSLQNEILLAFNNRDRLSYKPDVVSHLRWVGRRNSRPTLKCEFQDIHRKTSLQYF